MVLNCPINFHKVPLAYSFRHPLRGIQPCTASFLARKRARNCPKMNHIESTPPICRAKCPKSPHLYQSRVADCIIIY